MRTPETIPLTVWIVEDRADYRQAIVELLASQPGIAPAAAFESCEALLKALPRDVPPEVVLMDIGLPGIDGIEGVRRVRAMAPATQVVMLTIHEDDDRIFDALCAGASGYLLKTTPAAQILHALDELGRGGAAMTPQIARRVLQLFSRLRPSAGKYDLTEREKEVLQKLVEGHTKQAIADALFVSFHTIDAHLRNIYGKLHVTSRSGAVAKAVKERLV